MRIVRPALTRAIVCASFACLTVLGCKSEVSAQQAAATAAGELAPAQGQAAAPTPAVAKSKYDEAAFLVEMTVPGTVKVGETAKVLITLLPKAPFHVNAEYPHRFKVASLQGATTPSPVVARDPAKLTPSKLELEVPIVAGQPGVGSLEGEVALSVCTDEKCLMEKRQLKVTFQAN
jgi:hypothetical protein